MERLQEWAASDKCLSVMGNVFFANDVTLFDDDL